MGSNPSSSAFMPSPDSTPILLPDTVVLGRLRVERTLGSGGMGMVYEVEHQITKHRRALKVLHARAAQQPGIIERFLREASAAGRIGNPHVAETFDAGRLDTGEPYLLMELVTGETLEQRIARSGPLEPGELADLVYQVCEGVQAAHDAGIVHRDLKPENLIVTPREGAPFVKILDFGISKFDADRTGAVGITTEGLVMGTPYYMSPEQVRGAPIDARTDVYSLGVILYECASGTRPYDARSVEALAVLIHEGKAVSLRERRPSLTRAFCAIVERAMAADRERRFQSARALADALAPLRVRTLHAPAHRSTPPRAVVRPSRRPPTVGEGAPNSAMVPSTDAALAATMGSGPVPRQSGPSRAPALLALGAIVAAVLGAAAFWAETSRTPSAPVSPSAGVARWPERPEPASAKLALPEIAPSARGASSAESIEVGVPFAAIRARASAQTPEPSAKPASKSRVDRTGLAGENPFR
ncbi:MAG: protein kinase [Polyangiaceae bacterium]